MATLLLVQTALSQAPGVASDGSSAAVSASAGGQTGEQKLESARAALHGQHKDTVKAKELLLGIIEKDKATLQPGSLCYVYVYLGYIEDRATNREQAVSWYHKASGIMEADQWIRECAEYGLKEPLTWIRHLDEDAAPKRQAASPAASSNAAPADARLDAKVKFAARQASVQDIVQSLAQQAGLGYEWKKSFAQTDPLCRRWVNNVAIEGKPCREALDEILMPVGLRYQVEHDAIVLFRQ